MGLFKSVMKKVALIAAVVVGKRVITKVAGDISQKMHERPTKAPVKAAAKPKVAAKPKAAAKPKTAAAKPAPKATAAAKPKVAAAAAEKTKPPSS